MPSHDETQNITFHLIFLLMTQANKNAEVNYTGKKDMNALRKNK